MDSSVRINTIIKYKLLVILGLFFVVVLNGARQDNQIRQISPLHDENRSTIKSVPEIKDNSFTYNEIYPKAFLEFGEE